MQNKLFLKAADICELLECFSVKLRWQMSVQGRMSC